MKQSALPTQQLPTCETCNLQPLPQSSQYLVLIIIQLILILISLKISFIVLLVGYCFSKTVWICPMCKRQVPVQSDKAQQSTKDYIIVRLNDFMLLISKGKFRIVAVILIGLTGYWYFKQPTYEYQPKVKIQKTWKSIVSNCGYDMYMENSFKFRYFYSMYEDTYDWNLEGIYLSSNQKNITRKAEYVVMKIKMNPTQFKDQNTQDIELVVRNPGLQFEKGDVVKIKGEWSGNRQHVLIFLGSSIEKTNKKIVDFNKQIEILTHGSLRAHLQ